MGKYIAIDYGTERIGVAISDELGMIAQAVNPISNISWKKVISQLCDIVDNGDFVAMIVGLPLGLDNKPTKMSLEVEKFVEELQKVTNLDVVKWNETLSTKSAQLIKRKLKNKRLSVDSESARIILQEYLDHKGN